MRSAAYAVSAYGSGLGFGAFPLIAVLVLRASSAQVSALSAVGPAVGALMECARQGRRVPDEISIIGFGNFEVGTQSYPSLTTVSVDAQQIGRRTGEYLLGLFELGPTEGGRTIDLGFELQVRESTAPARR